MSRRRTLGFLAGGIAVFCLGAALSGNASTYASFSDNTSVQARVGAGVWAPNPPVACGPVSSYRRIVWGTTGDDVLTGGNHPQIIMGLDGDDVIQGGNSGDCLVGGAGNDRLLGGNGKDTLIGGPGDDYLSGSNAKDALDGSEDVDVCEGGNGNDTVVNCEYDNLADRPLPAPADDAATTGQPAPVPTPPRDPVVQQPEAPSPGGDMPPAEAQGSTTADPEAD